MKPLDDYMWQRREIFAYFGYVEDWRILPLDDAREFYWRLDGEGPGTVTCATTEEELRTGEGNCFQNEIYTQRHLPKWVYRGPKYTMVVVYTHTDGNQLLQVFDNSKER